MWKKIAAGCLGAVLICGLAYYSGYLYTSNPVQEEKISLEEELYTEQQTQIFPDETTESAESAQEQTADFQEEPREVSTDPDSVHAETEEFSYYLVEEFGYVNIYQSDKESIYEYTDIPIDSLPEDLQQEICTGKGIAGEQELYDFLENYSS